MGINLFWNKENALAEKTTSKTTPKVFASDNKSEGSTSEFDEDIEQIVSSLPQITGKSTKSFAPFNNKFNAINKTYDGAINPSFDKIIAPSNKILEKDLTAYLEKNTAWIPVVDDYEGQTFTMIDGTRITSTNEDTVFWDDIYQIITSLENTACIDKLQQQSTHVIKHTSFKKQMEKVITTSLFTSGYGLCICR